MNITALSPRVAAAGVMLAGPAHADPDTNTDGDFLAALEHSSIAYRSTDRAVAAGHAVCGQMDGGKSGIEVITDVQKNNPGVTVDDAAQFVAIPANQYCPGLLG